ncbi:MAG: threonine--tRNA ligase [Candidatus Woesebacteria bacterium]|nr:threonine--tRNA ligase [Candidatus Woesebacteria bacterium]
MINKIDNLRHSCAHLMAAAVLKLYPSAKPTIGPVIENGFYYDFDNLTISDSDFTKIEKEMKNIVKSWSSFEKIEVTYEEAKKAFKDNPYKLELIEELTLNHQPLTLYKSGEFVDLCRGGHIENPKEIKYFKLISVAGAYWRGNEKNKMLTRIYGTTFSTKEELDNYINLQEEAKKRDHRKLNKQLKIYMASDDIGQGLITLLPNGAIIAQELEKWAIETENKWGYIRVYTPHIVPEKLFKISGHVPYYVPSMFPPMRMSEKDKEDNEIYYLKPMNCAGHHMVYKSEPRSYRDLPLRIAEYGAVYRFEQSGELLGMMRVRGPIHQNDAHIFCTEEQAEEEFQKVMELHEYYYNTLGISKKDYYLSFATRGPKNKDKYTGNDEIWEKAEKIALKYIEKTGIPYKTEVGGAAFYGPKIDFNIKTVTGKVFSASTNQLDFFLPKAFGLTYIDKDGKEKTPVCIHRAPLGAHVRFIAFLMEHFAGNFPTWLTPIQVKVLPISEKHLDYAKKVGDRLKEEGIRVEVDVRGERLQAKIRDAQLEKVAYMLIVGDREEKEGTVAERGRSGKDYGAQPLDKFIENIKKEIKEKTIN